MNDTGKSAKLAKYDRLYEQIKGYNTLSMTSASVFPLL